MPRGTPPPQPTQDRLTPQPRELGGAVLWLSAPESGFVTGQTIVVDGGQLLA